jgi:hypothetical protein
VKRKELTMTPPVQVSRQLQYVFIALVLGSVAVIQSAQGETTDGNLIANVTEEDNPASDLASEHPRGCDRAGS